jgi:hypothetical protein
MNYWMTAWKLILPLLIALGIGGVASAGVASSIIDNIGAFLLSLLAGGAIAGTAASVVRDKKAKRQQVIEQSLRDLFGLSRNQKATQDACVAVFAPSAAPPLAEIIIQAFVHAPDMEEEAQAISLRADPNADKLASIPLALPLQRNDLIKVSLETGAASIVDPVQFLHWNCRLAYFVFEVHLPDSAVETSVRFKLRVFANGVPAGTVIFSVLAKPAIEIGPAALVQQQARTFRRPFLSYASEDRGQVLRAAQLISALRMEFFQDVLTLEPGETWRNRLFSEIDKCDVFLLFWSRHARESKWVTSEAEYALRRSKSRSGDSLIEIVPVLLEGPPPVSPPPSLAEIHFNDALQYVIFAEESVAKEKQEKALRVQRILAPVARYPFLTIMMLLLFITVLLLVSR